eukprot:GHVU01213686.1.p1 GENE.GHVU01213686.1~~GHVU01213686.1.p1  ORF type:complete len:136 (+),score=2.66 GHVU01213686.1:446-853(+)
MGTPNNISNVILLTLGFFSRVLNRMANTCEDVSQDLVYISVMLQIIPHSFTIANIPAVELAYRVTFFASLQPRSTDKSSFAGSLAVDFRKNLVLLVCSCKFMVRAMGGVVLDILLSTKDQHNYTLGIVCIINMYK